MKKVEGREIKKKKTKSTVTIKKCRKKIKDFTVVGIGLTMHEFRVRNNTICAL